MASAKADELLAKYQDEAMTQYSCRQVQHATFGGQIVLGHRMDQADDERMKLFSPIGGF